MSAPPSLPDPNTLEVFEYYDPALDGMVDIVYANNTHPRVIEDYVVDAVDWQPANRGNDRGDGAGPPNATNTVQGILGWDTGDLVCFVCDQRGTACPGQECIDIAQQELRDVADIKLQIRQARWGYGVFAWANIPSGILIGEYLGRLMPLDNAYVVDNRYTFTIGGHADSNAERFGNVMRYINHHCDSNTEPVTAMYGRRAAVVFRTTRAIAEGEEVTIDYGLDYFGANFPCQCDALNYPHTSEMYRRRVHPDGTVSPRGVGTYGPIKGQRGGGSRKSILVGPVAGAGTSGSKVANAGVKKMTPAPKAKTRPPKAKTRGRTRGRASAPKARRRRSWGSRAYKGGDPDRYL